MSEAASNPKLGVRTRGRIPLWFRLDPKAAFLLGAVLLAYLPLLSSLAQWLWNRDHYSFFPFAIIVCAWLFARALVRHDSETPSQPWLRILVIGLAVAILTFSVILVSPWLAGVSAMITLLGLLYAIGGADLVRRSFAAWLLLWLIIPVPLSYDREFILFLQRLATNISSGILDFLGFRHVIDGVVLRLPDRSYQVEEACSGVQSLFAALFCSGLYVIVSGNGVVRSLVLLASSVYWVLLANVARIVAVVVLKEVYDLPLDQDFYHKLTGAGFFVLAMLGVYSTEKALDYFWPSLNAGFWETGFFRPWHAHLHHRKSKKLSRFFHNRELYVLIATFSILAAIQWVSMAVGGSLASTSPSTVAILDSEDKELLPSELLGWQRTDAVVIRRDADDVNGEISRLWVYRKGDAELDVSLDGPYLAGWHQLDDCYRGQGWNPGPLLAYEYRDEQGATGGGYAGFDVQDAHERRGYVVFGLFDAEFRPFVVPDVRKLWRQQGKLRDFVDRVADLFGGGKPSVARSDSVSFQVHVFRKQLDTLSAADRDECRHVLERVREVVSRSGMKP